MSSTTPEYQTLISLTDELRRAVQSDLTPICGKLMAEHLISFDNASRLSNQMRSEIDRAAELVDIVQNKVKQNPQHYHTFVQVLKSQGIDYYHDILEKLNEVYEQRRWPLYRVPMAKSGKPASFAHRIMQAAYKEKSGPLTRMYNIRSVPVHRKIVHREEIKSDVPMQIDKQTRQSRVPTRLLFHIINYCNWCSVSLLLMLSVTLIGWLLMKNIRPLPVHRLQMTEHNISMPDARFIYFETHTCYNSKINQTINLTQFGFKLHFLPNTSLEPVSFTIGVSSLLPGFISPANSTLVSAFYYIKTSSELLQPVIVEVQHCNGLLVDDAGLTFAKATVESDNSSPYIFTKLSGGRFDRKYWGTIKLSIFSFVAVFNEGENSYVDYLAHLLSLHRKGGADVYQVVLIASLDLNAYKKDVKTKHKGWVPIVHNPIPFVFNNGSTALTLSISREGIQSGNWEIKPMVMPPEIKRSAIHRHGLVAYELKVSWTNKWKEDIPLEYFMDVQGVNLESFMIYIDPREQGTAAAIIGDDHHIQECTKIEDFNKLYQLVAEIGDWTGLCSYLGVNSAKMNELKHSNGKNGEKKQECLQAYFDTGEAYWEKVVKVIKEYPISNRRVAKDIVEKQELRSELLDDSFVITCS